MKTTNHEFFFFKITRFLKFRIFRQNKIKLKLKINENLLKKKNFKKKTQKNTP
jgi:hypothetical protein